MANITVVCKNPDCTKRLSPMVCTGETWHAWSFQCKACGALRAVTKDKIGGVVGAGKRDHFK